MAVVNANFDNLGLIWLVVGYRVTQQNRKAGTQWYSEYRRTEEDWECQVGGGHNFDGDGDWILWEGCESETISAGSKGWDEDERGKMASVRWERWEIVEVLTWAWVERRCRWGVLDSADGVLVYSADERVCGFMRVPDWVKYLRFLRNPRFGMGSTCFSTKQPLNN